MVSTSGIHRGANTHNQPILTPNNLQTNKTINNRPGNPIPFLTITLLDIEI